MRNALLALTLLTSAVLATQSSTSSEGEQDDATSSLCSPDTTTCDDQQDIALLDYFKDFPLFSCRSDPLACPQPVLDAEDEALFRNAIGRAQTMKELKEQKAMRPKKHKKIPTVPVGVFEISQEALAGTSSKRKAIWKDRQDQFYERSEVGSIPEYALTNITEYDGLGNIYKTPKVKKVSEYDYLGSSTSDDE